MAKKKNNTAPEEIKPVEEIKPEVKETLDLGFNDSVAPEATAVEPEAPAEPIVKPKRQRRIKAELNQANQAPAETWGSQDENANAQEEPTEAQGTTLASVFPSGGLVTVLDKLMSVLMPLSINAIAGTKLNKKDFALDASEKKAISPALDEAAKTIPINFNNPWVNLSVVLGGVYLGKTLQVINLDNMGEDKPKKQRRTKAEIEAERNSLNN
jgi:predicted secreted protein